MPQDPWFQLGSDNTPEGKFVKKCDGHCPWEMLAVNHLMLCLLHPAHPLLNVTLLKPRTRLTHSTRAPYLETPRSQKLLLPTHNGLGTIKRHSIDDHISYNSTNYVSGTVRSLLIVARASHSHPFIISFTWLVAGFSSPLCICEVTGRTNMVKATLGAQTYFWVTYLWGIEQIPSSFNHSVST